MFDTLSLLSIPKFNPDGDQTAAIKAENIFGVWEAAPQIWFPFSY